MPAPYGASATEASAAERRAVEVSLDISRHLARVDVAAAAFSSGSDGSSNGDYDSAGSVDIESIVGGSSPDVAETAGVAEGQAAGPAKTARSDGSGGSRGEFFVEPEWQRVPGRWTKFEDKLLREMKAELQEDLRAAPPFPEVVGSRRMLRFLRGHKHDAHKAAAMMRQMLQWRKDNNVDAIREDILQNQKFNPSQFPEGEMITRLFPLLVANPLCVDMDGAPISYESYEFSPRQVTAHANGDLGFFIKFHIYCQEFKQICLDSLSDAKEMENLARRAAERATSPPPPPQPRQRETEPSNGNGVQLPGRSSTGAGRNKGRAGASVSCGDRSPSPSPEEDRPQALLPAVGISEIGGVLDGGVAAGEGGGGEGREEEEEEPWGVVLRNTIIRDLAGFGMEHAGPIGRSLISQVLAVSQDNYPEMMEKCLIINAPWVFYALWKGLTPLVSANTAKKVQVLKYDFLANLCETISLERLPVSAGGGCDPAQATPDQVHDFVVCGRVAEVPGAGGDGDKEGGGAGGTDEEGRAASPAAGAEAGTELKVRLGSGGDGLLAGPEGRVVDGAVAMAAASSSGGGGGNGRGSWRSSRQRSSGSSGDGDRAASQKKPHVTFRSLFERLQARDEPTSAAAKLPLSRASSFQEHMSPSSPPLSRQGSNASLAGGGGGSGRPFASPGPRGVRRATSAGVGGGGGGYVAVNDERSPSHGDEQAEDFDSRLVGRALRLSMKRKAQRFKTVDAGGGDSVFDDVDVDVNVDVDADGSVDSSASPLPSGSLTLGGGRSPEEHDKGGWAKKKWRALRERRESKKMLEKGFLNDLPGLSAGDCAEWIPNSARNSCLHCERPFTLLLRRHHCRMCGELVCGHCSPHRVRLAGDEKEKEEEREPATDGSGDAGGNGGGGGGAAQGVSSHRSWRSRHARKEKEGDAPKPLAVRVCTDCHFSLQTVTVASASAIKDRGSSDASIGGRNGGRDGGGGETADGNIAAAGGGERGGDNDESLPRRMGDGPRRIGDGGGAGAGARGVLAQGDLDLGGGGGGGGGFVESLDAVYLAEEIAGDVVLGDVLEWNRIERRASKCLGVLRMCLLVVVELHHKKLLEMGLRLWRASSTAISSAAKHAAATLASSNQPSPSSSSAHGEGDGNGRRGGDGAISASTAPPAASAQPSLRSSNNGRGNNGGGDSAGREGSLRDESQLPSPSTTRAAAGAQGEVYARSSEAVVARAETAVWAVLDRAATLHYSAWVLLMAMLPLAYRLC